MELDPSALMDNVGEIRRCIGDGVKIIASVKANAYGHGIEPVGRVLSQAGVEMLATGSFAEAVALRDAGVKTPILLLAGALPNALGDVVARGFIPTIYDMDGARAVDKIAKVTAPVFVKVDCGLGRLGIPLDEAPNLLREVASLTNVQLQGLYTHLSFKDSDGMAYARQRLALFYELVTNLRAEGLDIPVTQAIASSALVLGWSDGCSAVCPGHILFGLNSLESDMPDDVVRLNSRVTVEFAPGAQQTFQLVPSTRGDLKKGKVSVVSTFGASLVGLAVGDQIQFGFPTDVQSFKIIGVEQSHQLLSSFDF